MRRLLLIGVLFAAVVAGGCSSSSFYVPVTMPREINLGGASTVGVALFRSSGISPWQVPVTPNEMSRAFGGPFAADTRFNTVMLYEYSGIPEPLNANALTKNTLQNIADATGANMLVLGEVLQLAYDEDIITADVRRFQKEDGKQVVRKGLLQLRVHIRVFDTHAKEMVWNEVMEHAVKAETSAADAEPALIDPLPLAYDAAAQLARDVLARTESVKQSVLATFLTDSDYPGIDGAIRKAQAGDWPEALRRFQSLAEQAKGTDDEHKLLYDLGMAYQFNYNFRQAKESFERAYKLKDSQRYKIAIDECLKMEQMYQETLNQQ